MVSCLVFVSLEMVLVLEKVDQMEMELVHQLVTMLVLVLDYWSVEVLVNLLDLMLVMVLADQMAMELVNLLVILLVEIQSLAFVEALLVLELVLMLDSRLAMLHIIIPTT